MAERQHATDQGILTVVAPITPGRAPALRAVLKEIAAQLPPHPRPPEGGLVPFARLLTVHFARWVILEEARDAGGVGFPAQLVMSTAYDAPLDRHLAELVSVARAGLDAIYDHCVGYPQAGGRSADRLVAYLRAHTVPPAAVFISTRWRTVTQIRAEAALRDALEDVLDERVADRAAPPPPEEIRAALIAHVARTPELQWALEPAASPASAWWLGHYGRLVAIVAGLIAGLPILLPIGIVMLLLLRRAERRDDALAPAAALPDLGQLDALTQLEDFDVQNQMTLVSVVKPGRLRRLVLQAVVLYARFRIAYIDTKGALVGIPSIHFAHWNLIDGGRRLLFLSNYDGTWESYLGEFIDRAASGLTAVWSNTLGFPRTRFLALDGARDEQGFKAWVRTQQIPTEVWYAAYPRRSVVNINNDTALRAGLSAPLRGAALAAWLRRL
jgi:hypothetical protein